MKSVKVECFQIENKVWAGLCGVAPLDVRFDKRIVSSINNPALSTAICNQLLMDVR
jgi:hypothetical protein